MAAHKAKVAFGSIASFWTRSPDVCLSPNSAREQTFRDRSFGPENEPAYAGARCAREFAATTEGPVEIG